MAIVMFINGVCYGGCTAKVSCLFLQSYSSDLRLYRNISSALSKGSGKMTFPLTFPVFKQAVYNKAKS